MIMSIIIIISSFFLYFSSKYIFQKMILDSKGNIQTKATFIFQIYKYLLLFITLGLILYYLNIPYILIAAIIILIGLIFQKTIGEISRGYYIIFKDIYHVGEIIMINDIKGEILKINHMCTTIKGSNGQEYIFYHSDVKNVLNCSRSFGLAIVDINIPFSIEYSKIWTLLEENLKIFYDSDMIMPPKLTGIENLNINNYTIRISCMCKTYQNFEIERKLRLNVLEILTENEIYIN